MRRLGAFVLAAALNGCGCGDCQLTVSGGLFKGYEVCSAQSYGSGTANISPDADAVLESLSFGVNARYVGQLGSSVLSRDALGEAPLLLGHIDWRVTALRPKPGAREREVTLEVLDARGEYRVKDQILDGSFRGTIWYDEATEASKP